MNPMKDFKEASKEVLIQGKKVVFKSLSSKEIEEINESIKNTLQISDDVKLKEHPKYSDEFQTSVLALCIKSIDGVKLDDFDEVKQNIKNGANSLAAKKEEVTSWDSVMSSILFGYYLKFLDEKNRRYDKDLNFLKG